MNNRKKIEKKLTILVKELIRQGMIDADKKDVADNFATAREYEIRELCEAVEAHYKSRFEYYSKALKNTL